MEQQKKNELGNIYGSRISKNGNWLNLLIVTHINGEEVRITCPVRIIDDYDDLGTKPYATIEYGQLPKGEEFVRFPVNAVIANLPIYEDRKPTPEKAAAEDSDLPF